MPKKARPLTYSRQWIESDDLRSVVRALKSDWLTQGPCVEAFEKEFAAFVGARHAVAVSSGTAALHAACAAAGIGPGDEVIVPPITFAASSNAVLYCGGTPVFCDVEAETALIDVEQIEKVATDNTKAIIPVDFAGHPCDIDRIVALAKKRGWVVIEDAAHGLGAEYKGRRVGALADLTIFSFHPVKHITTGEGGMVTTDDTGLAQKVRIFRQHGITKDPALLTRSEGPWYYEMQSLGFNYRITDFQCALGSSQLAKAMRFVNLRRKLAQTYTKLLTKVDGVQPAVEKTVARHSYHLYPVRIDFRKFGVSRKELFERLRAKNILPQVHYIPVHLQPYYQHRLKTGPGQFPKAEAFYESELSLPLHPQLSAADVRSIVTALKAALGAR